VDVDWGWEFTQDYTTDTSPSQEYYTLMFGLYSEQSLTFHPELQVYQVFYTNLLAQVD